MEKVVFGKLVNTHGLRGEVKIISDSDFKDERFKKGSKIFIGDLEVTIKSHRVHKNFDLVVFEEFNNINDVEKYKGTDLFIDKKDLKELVEDEFYYHQLEGMEVFNGTELVGVVIEVRDMPSKELLVIKGKEKSIYVPFVDEFIKEVDIDGNKIIIEAIEGLL